MTYTPLQQNALCSGEVYTNEFGRLSEPFQIFSVCRSIRGQSSSHSVTASYIRRKGLGRWRSVEKTQRNREKSAQANEKKVRMSIMETKNIKGTVASLKLLMIRCTIYRHDMRAHTYTTHSHARQTHMTSRSRPMRVCTSFCSRVILCSVCCQIHPHLLSYTDIRTEI